MAATTRAVEHSPAVVTGTVGEATKGCSVVDDGPGIPEDERPSVFESGYTTREKGPDSVSRSLKQIAQAHGWTGVVSESEAGGPRFDVSGVAVVR